MIAVDVSTPCRLHFGLLRLAQPSGPQFGGLGMMIDRPRAALRAAAADEWHVSGPQADRVQAVAKQAIAALGDDAAIQALRIEVQSTPPSHRGLGSGTQLALAVAAAVRRLARLPDGSADDLARMAARGTRSAVGSHGFVHGGLIWEQGQLEGDSLGQLTARLAVPSTWRIVLIAPARGSGLSGHAEQAAFAELPPAPTDQTRAMAALVEHHILPAVKQDDVESFGEAVHEYGRLSGELFADVQGGPYASSKIARCVAAIRAAGVPGAGQSSWGPTVFAVVRGDQRARDLIDRLRTEAACRDCRFDVVAADNVGAVIREAADAGQLAGTTGTSGGTDSDGSPRRTPADG